jgi:hypothetical protein
MRDTLLSLRRPHEIYCYVGHVACFGRVRAINLNHKIYFKYLHLSIHTAVVIKLKT